MELKILNLSEYNESFSNPRFEDSYCTFWKKPSNKKIKKIVEFYKLKEIPKDLKELYNRLDFFSIQYEYRLKNNRVSLGCTSIFSTDDFISGKRFTGGKRIEKFYLKGFLWDEKDNSSYIENIKKYFIIDYVDTISNTYVLGKFNKNKIKLFFYKYPDFIFPLTIDLFEYVKIAESCRGIQSWQNYFIDLDDLSGEMKEYLSNERVVDVPKVLEEVFPTISVNKKIFNKKYFNKKHIDKIIKIDYFTLIHNKFNQLEDKIIKRGGYYNLITENKYGPRPLELHTINKVEHIIGQKLPDEMLNFYLHYNGFLLSWNYKDKIKANFELIPFQQIFGGREPHKKRHWTSQLYEGIVSMEEVMDKKDLIIAKESYPILFSEFIDVVFYFPKNKPMKLYAIIKGKYIPLSINFKEFIDIILGTMGMDFWYILLPDFNHNKHQGNYSNVKKDIKEIFPEFKIPKIDLR